MDASAQSVPILDLAEFRSGDGDRRNRFIAQLAQAYESIGFVGVRGHGISNSVFEELYEAMWAFVALSDAQKIAYHRPELFGQRGYTPKGQEHAKGSKVGDLKEFFHVGQELEEAKRMALNCPANVWPAEVPEFRTAAIKVYRALESLGQEMLVAISAVLKLPHDYFVEPTKDGNSILRLAHYFPIEDPEALPPGAVRAAAHGDINLITLLVGASADGLELLRRDKTWVPVRVQPDEIVINVGDMLERLTNGRLRSTIHRVVNPPPELAKTARLSMPFFFHPRAEMDLSVLPSCVNADNPRRFDPITAGAFLTERLREIGLK